MSRGAKALIERAENLGEYRFKTQIKALREKTDAMEREIEALRRALDVSEDLAEAPRIKPIVRREKTSGLREATPVIMVSDLHVGEVVKPETVNWLNAYNPKIARERSVRMDDAIEWEITHERHAFKIRDVFLWLGGDLITGFIHDELVENNAMSPTQELLFAQELNEARIDRILSLDIERLVVACDHGNHGRTTAKKRISTGAYNSFEWLMYHSLKRRYAHDKRVEFVISDGIMSYYKIYDTILRTTHGDSIRYGGGVGGITVPVLKKIAQWNKSKFAHETLMGHFHTSVFLEGLCVNGSMIGYGPFSEFIGAAPEAPSQNMFLVDSKRGKCHVKKLWLSKDKSK